MAAEAVGGTTEQVEAEWPLLAHLKAMGWQHMQGARLQGAGNVRTSGTYCWSGGCGRPYAGTPRG